MNNLAKYILSVMSAVCLLLTSCEDLIYDDAVLSGESTVAAEVSFKHYTPALETKAAGDAIKTINSLWLVVYNGSGEFIEKRQIVNYTVNIRDNERPDGTTSAEKQTGHAEFTMQFKNGKYKIYAIANYDLSADDVTTEDKLKKIGLTWEEDPANVAQNGEMFGYFAPNDEKSATGFDAPVITVSPATAKLHAWVKRAASKLTIAFNTQNLKENTYIYIKSVAVKDIAKNCYLGADNRPVGKDALISTGEVFYFANAEASHTDAKANYSKWRRITKGTTLWGYNSEKNGAYKGEDKNSVDALAAYEHSETAPAIYFYENLQGQGEEGTVTDKRQDVTGANNQVSYPDGVKEDNLAWKDAMPWGTYVEVEGYYVCEDVKRLGRGPIKYRFMLGKDIIKDYDVERNHHYKLTLNFNGYANDIDWHIDYDEENTPGFFVPDTSYVSYYYNQPASVAVRATPKLGYKLQKIETIIIENEWRPHDAGNGVADYNTTAWSWQMNGTGGYAGGAAKAATLDAECQPNCEFGFLSLRYDSHVNIEMGSNSNKADFVNEFRKTYYDGSKMSSNDDIVGSLGKRVYTGFPTADTDDNPIYENTPCAWKAAKHLSTTSEGYKNYTLEVPLFTRAKSLDSWAVFSGANAFIQNFRKARLKFIATYVNETNSSDKYTEVEYTTVLQARRIENPAAIYRKKNSSEQFHVNLKYTLLSANAAGNRFNNFTSQGPWSATIAVDPNGIVQLEKDGVVVRGQGNAVTGHTGTEIDFVYKPNPEKASLNAGAVITVRFHNYSCIHNIVIRQGYDPIVLVGTTKWASYNVYNASALTKSPLSVGSLFNHNTDLSKPISEANNTTYGVGAKPPSTYAYKISGSTNTYTWEQLSGVTNYAPASLFTTFVSGYRLPTYDEVNAVLTSNNMDFNFGITYGDGATEVDATANAYSFTDPNNSVTTSTKGVRGVCAYNNKTGSNIFFPFGSTGHARRKCFYYTGTTSLTKNRGYGVMQYGTVDVRLVRDNDNYRPMAYDLPAQSGGPYWLNNAAETDGVAALDFNYGNYMTAGLGESEFMGSSGSDALPIRPVVK